jgi:hypothetical protein
MGVVFVHKDVLNKGLEELLKTNQVVVLKSYAANDSHATALAGPNAVLTESITGGDMSISDHGTHDRKWQCNGKSGVISLIGTSNADDLHIAYVDTTTSRVLYVTDEITDQEITLGNPVDVPAAEYRSLQPTPVA